VRAWSVVAGFVLITFVLWDAFETIILSRRVSRKIRLATLFYRLTWPAWRTLGLRMKPGNPRENYLSIYGPLSLIGLLILWALSLVVSFALLLWGLGAPLQKIPGTEGFSAYLYYSGTTFFTLGLGDVAPLSTPGRALSAVEAGTGFAFLALMISYLPVLYQAFSRREVDIALLDARAGSPPSAAELLRRHAGDPEALGHLLLDWERWSAQVLESQISFPVLAYFRSQHDNQSWLAALTTILDSASLVIVSTEGALDRSARLTFAMARHAIADMNAIFSRRRRVTPVEDRLPPEEVARLAERLAASGYVLPTSSEALARLGELRGMYEPYALALSRHFLMPLPSWLPPAGAPDNWQRLEQLE
jgi:Ion channel